MNKGIKLIILFVILIVAIVWTVISLQNVFKAQQEVELAERELEIAERELDESIQALDVSLENCLSVYTYNECRQGGFDGCTNLGITRERCEEIFAASYQRITS